MGASVVTPSTALSVSLDEVKSHLRVRHAEDDGYIEALIRSATRLVEKTLEMSLMTQTLKATFDEFSDTLELPFGPVTEVVAVRYWDAEGLEQEVSEADYTLDLTGKSGWVVRNDATSWPTTLDAVNVVSVEYIAGHDVLPAELVDLKHAILLLVGHFYFNRGDAAEELPRAINDLVQPYRTMAA